MGKNTTHGAGVGDVEEVDRLGPQLDEGGLGEGHVLDLQEAAWGFMFLVWCGWVGGRVGMCAYFW